MALKFNPFTGNFDFDSGAGAAGGNFSYLKIPVGESVTIADGQQMLYDGELTIDGELEVDGEISEIVNYSEWAFGWNTIPADAALYVQSVRDFLFSGLLTIDGSITIDGNLIEVA